MKLAGKLFKAAADGDAALLAAGASPHARMHNIITPLDMADSPEIVAILQNLS